MNAAVKGIAWILAGVVLSAFVMGQDPSKTKPVEKLTATISTDKTAVTLGESVQVEFRLENVGDADVEVNELVFEDRSVNFAVSQDLGGGKKKDFTFTVTRPDAFSAPRVPPVRVVLKPKKSLVTYFKIPTIKAGLMTITGHYHGAANPVASSPMSVDVKPAGKDSRLVVNLETSKGNIAIVLFPDESPNTVMNFVARVQSGFYDGLLFYRLVKDFVIQTGCPHDLGTGGPGYSVKGEAEGSARKHELGTVSMARYERNDHTGSQFFICLKNLPVLDRQYTIIGKVQDTAILQTLNDEPADKATEKPVKDIVLKKATIQVQ